MAVCSCPNNTSSDEAEAPTTRVSAEAIDDIHDLSDDEDERENSMLDPTPVKRASWHRDILRAAVVQPTSSSSSPRVPTALSSAPAVAVAAAAVSADHASSEPQMVLVTPEKQTMPVLPGASVGAASPHTPQLAAASSSGSVPAAQVAQHVPSAQQAQGGSTTPAQQPPGKDNLVSALQSSMTTMDQAQLLLIQKFMADLSKTTDSPQ